MSLKVLFWNINKNDNDFIEQLVSVANDIDILLLAESQIEDSLIKQKLNLDRVIKVQINENKLTPKLYSRLAPNVLEHNSTAQSQRICFFTLQTQEYDEIILAGLHFPSKLYYDGATQSDIAKIYSLWISEIEKIRKHKRTIVFGDFNMNPFEEGMISPMGFNSTLSADIAKKGNRTFHHQEFDYFYNPMWNWLGDIEHNSGNKKIPGSFYYKSTTDVNQIFWNVFDKVIVRHELIDVLDYSSIKIIDVKNTILKDQNYNLPDHLPLTFNLNITPL